MFVYTIQPVVKLVVSCIQTFNRLSNQFDNWIDNRLYRVNGALECMFEIFCMRLAENAGRKKTQKIAIWAPSHSFVGLYLRNWSMCLQLEKAC